MATLIESNFEAIMVLENWRLCWKISEGYNMRTHVGSIQRALILIFAAVLNYPFDNGALFNFQIIRAKCIVLYQYLMALRVLICH